MFITFEGIEGCGKTTQITLLGQYLKKNDLEFLVTREPGGTIIGDKIRKILLDPQNSRITPLAELLLYAANRSQHVNEIIKPAIKKDRIVLCDRFCDATFVYQGFARGLDLGFIKKLNLLVSEEILPELTFLIDCPVQVGLSRANSRMNSPSGKKGEDRFERESISFHQKIREGYLLIAKQETRRVAVIDGTKDKNTVHREICRVVSSRIF